MNCYNCGADEGLHHYQTKQCPLHGKEETRFDKLAGKFYPQQWVNTTFEDAETKKMERAAPEMAKALKAARDYLKRYIEFDVILGGEAEIINQIENALQNAGCYNKDES